jgi:F0F1-type ATP synthase assembly protein I
MSDPNPDGEKKERNPLVVAGVVGALGFEFVGIVIGCFWIGSTLDDRFGVGPWGTVGCLAAGMLGGAWHVYLITKRYLIEEDEGE